MLGIEDLVDRYDVREPQLGLSNSPGGSGVKSVAGQLIPCYRTIIWNTGDRDSLLIGDGTGLPEKASQDTHLFSP